MTNKTEGFPQMPSRGVHDELKELLKDVKQMHLGLLLYKLLPFKYEVNDLLNGVKPENFADKLKETLQDLENSSYAKPQMPDCERSFRLKTAYRLVIGMGYPSLLENGFLFHHTYGIPYIPGETLKGLARHVLLLSLHEIVKNKPMTISSLEEYLLKPQEDFEKETLTKELDGKEIVVIFSEPELKITNPHRLFRRLFGTLERSGEVIFFDAFPENFKPKDLELDIMNPHYSGYYQSKGEKTPGDWENPVPVKFLALRKGVVFRFCLGYRPFSEDSQDLLNYAEALLKIGLLNFGVGGKKAKGYGWFEP